MTQSEDFAWAIAFSWWPIFKMVSFLEYLLFFGTVFCTEQLYMFCGMDFDMFFWILIFQLKWGFFRGYCLCMVADFQNGLISRIFGVFSSGFLHRTTLNDLRMDFDMFFCILNFDPKWGFCMGYSLCMMAGF